MKRPAHARDPTPDGDGNPTSAKKRKQDEGEEGKEAEARFAHLDKNLLFEVLKHMDARTLATMVCVSKQWHRTTQEERLWEIICTHLMPAVRTSSLDSLATPSKAFVISSPLSSTGR